MGDLSESDLHALYAQHTAETGQPFTPEALAQAWRYTQGQPWLVNALAREIVRNMEVPPEEPVRAAHIVTAAGRLVDARATHLDSVLARLWEPPVKRLIEPLIAGDAPAPNPAFDDDVAYGGDLGLVAKDMPLRIANPIYDEIIVRVLSTLAEAIVTSDLRSFVQPDGRLDLDELVQDFAAFWKANAETLTSSYTYQEVAPQLAIMAYLRRIVTGDGAGAGDNVGDSGSVDREFGVGRSRVDLLIRWPYRDETNMQHLQREAIELKVWRNGRPDPLSEGLSQFDGYLRRLGLDAGTLVIFDRRPDAPPIDERTHLTTVQSPSGRKITLLRA